MATIVNFLYHEANDDLFAFFPKMDYNKEIYGKYLKVSYSHVGQHSSCNVNYAKECIDATPEQYKDLFDELVSIGYTDLKILNFLKNKTKKS